MQCYDAFGVNQPLSDDQSHRDNDSEHSLYFVLVVSGGLSLLMLLVGIMSGYFYLKYRLVANVSDLAKPLPIALLYGTKEGGRLIPVEEEDEEGAEQTKLI